MFLILPVGVDYRAQRYPVVTFTLMGICTLVHLVVSIISLSSGEDALESIYENFALIPAKSLWWTYITSQFMHGDWLHLIGNMVYLFLFGSCVEDLIGRARYIIFYLLSGVAACFAFIAISPEHFALEIPLVGASGAISGCIGGFLLLLAKTKIEFKWFFWFMFRFWHGEFMLPAWLVISFWFLEDLLFMLVSNATGEEGGVAFAAHVGGTLVGLGIMATRKVWLKEEFQEEEEEQPMPAAHAPRPAARVRARATADPLPEETPATYLLLNGAQAGPFTTSQIQQMFALGSVPADSLYWQEGMDDWRTIDELRQPGLV